MKAVSEADANKIYQALRCPETSKVCFATERRALVVLKRAQTRGFTEKRHSHPPTRVYKCPRCHWWHLTSRKETPANDKKTTESRQVQHQNQNGGSPAAQA